MNYFSFGKSIKIIACEALDASTIQELWYGFCSCSCSAAVETTDKNLILIGNAEIILPTNNEEYAVNITSSGVSICGRDKSTLMRGFMMLLCNIENKEEGTFRIECGIIKGDFSIANRMVHLCIFPETPLSFFEKTLRLCGALQFTHAIVEFWGMLKYDRLGALAFEHAFDKAQIRPILDFARQMGIEIIPMFNHLGHASAARVTSGKHVVLDNDPSLSYLFSPDGWCWNITSEKVMSLLSQIRQELYELCGKGEYFHIGCDEAYTIENGYESNETLCKFLSKITNDVVKEGRRPIMWGDMLLHSGLAGYHRPQIDEKKSRERLDAIARETVIADWDYETTEIPVKASLYFKQHGFDTLGCPWYESKNINAYAETVKSEGLFGIMETTWHTLGREMGSLLTAARAFGLKESILTRYSTSRTAAAVMLRKVLPKKLPYEETGFVREQVREIIK